MKLNRRRRHESLQLATPGMIDIVFLLLIFFLVNSSFRPTERQIESRLADPTAASTSAPQEPLTIKILPLAGIYGYQVGGRQFVDRQSLNRWLKQWPVKSQSVMVMTPADAPIEMSILTINDCKQAGFETVSYVPVLNLN